jgi:hypothetical protein
MARPQSSLAPHTSMMSPRRRPPVSAGLAVLTPTICEGLSTRRAARKPTTCPDFPVSSKRVSSVHQQQGSRTYVSSAAPADPGAERAARQDNVSDGIEERIQGTWDFDAEPGLNAVQRFLCLCAQRTHKCARQLEFPSVPWTSLLRAAASPLTLASSFCTRRQRHRERLIAEGAPPAPLQACTAGPSFRPGLCPTQQISTHNAHKLAALPTRYVRSSCRTACRRFW